MTVRGSGAFPGAQVIIFLVAWVLQTGLAFLVILFDERRLSEERLERAWLPVTRDLLVVWGGLLTLPVHFAKTRGHLRSLRGAFGILLGFLFGVVLMFIGALACGFVLDGIATILGLPDE